MAQIPGGNVPVSKVELRIQCSDLIDKDVTSKSDPCAVLFMQDKGRWFEVGRTENIKNCLNPQFTKSFDIDYFFEEVQKVSVAVYDIDNQTPQLNDDDFLGQIECTLGQIVSGSPFSMQLLKKNGTKAGKGKITILAEEVSGVNDIFTLKFRAENLDKKDLFSKSDPYLEFSRQAPNGIWQVVHRSEVIKNNLNPQWCPFDIKAQKLCAGDFNKTLRVDVYDDDEDSEPDLIGGFTTTVTELWKAVDTEVSWQCINPKKKAKKSSYKNSGVVFLSSCKVTKSYSFLDFIFGGLQINFTVAIDFTGSNGNPQNPSSLHYINPYQPNEYEQAINGVGSVVQDYDSDKMYPCLGFGAKLPPNYDKVAHEFAVNFHPGNPFCAGIQGILEAYRMCIQSVQLYGPTNFSPIINHVARFGLTAQSEQGAKNYFVLLILTDGIITDMDKTRAAIVQASALPVSIIIVGVGEADFTAMNILDGDNGVLKAPDGTPCRRDIVQFVPFSDFKRASPAELAKHVLAEVPRQLTDYYKMMGIVPAPRPAAPQQDPQQAPPAP